MGRGGVRVGAGRPKGRGNIDTRALVELVEARPPGEPLEVALAGIAEDPSVPRSVRLCACRCLSGWLTGRTLRITGVGDAGILE
jgi:hypothetical protein